MPLDKVSITLRDSVLESVDARGERGAANRSGVISRDLERYYESLKRARAELREKLSEAELAAVLDNLNGVWMAEPVSVSIMWANVADGIALEKLDQKWNIDGPVLVAKLRTMPFIEVCALADAAERHWNRAGNQEDPPMSEALAD